MADAQSATQPIEAEKNEERRRSREAQRKAKEALGAKPWKPAASEETLPVFRLRDVWMEPSRGVQGEAQWLQFVGSVQLRLPLDGPSWQGITEEDFEVKACTGEVSAKCKASAVAGPLEQISGKLKKECDPKKSWCAIERDVHDPSGRRRVFVLSLAKKAPGKPWGEEIFQVSLFNNRKSFAWQANQALLKQSEEEGWVTLPVQRRSDVEDPFLVSRGWLCTELEQGQTEETLQWRIVLDQKKLDEALGKVPYYRLFAADCSARYFKLFIRGDESSPVLLGELGGQVCPEQTIVELTSVTREVEGHRIVGTMETVPCLDVTLVKDRDFLGLWSETLSADQEVLNQPQGSLEDFEAEQLRRQREPEPDREDWTPDDYADEQKDKADAAFKEGCYRDAIVYYTRGLRYTPRNEKLLSNRSACYLKICKYDLALEDALKAQEVQPSWSKIYFRKGQALRGLRRIEESVVAFREGQAIDPSNPEWDKEVKRSRALQEELDRRRSAKTGV